MTREEASDILELSPHAGAAERSTQHDLLRRQLEDKLAKAPTPGLREKYRTSLKQLEDALAVLSQTDDSASLPVIQKHAAGSKVHGGGVPSPRTASDSGLRSQDALPGDGPDKHRDGSSQQRRDLSPSPRQKSGGKEFLIVAVVAVVVLAGGGWFVLKTRAENEAKARLALEQKAEAERTAQRAKEQAEQERLARETAATAEKERTDRLFISLRSRMAELNVAYDAAMRSEQSAERELSELKSQQRDQRGATTPASRRLAAQTRSQENFVTWLRDNLPTHPARVAKARAEELLSARAAAEAEPAVAAYASALAQLDDDLGAAKAARTITGRTTLESNVPGATWRLTDAFGAEYSGTTPADLNEVGAGSVEVEFRYSTFAPVRRGGRLLAGENLAFAAEFNESVVRVRAVPATATISPAGKNEDGWQVYRLGPGRHLFRIEAPGHAPAQRSLLLGNGEKRDLEIKLTTRPSAVLLAEATALLPQANAAAQGLSTNYWDSFSHLLLWLGAVASEGDPEEFAAALGLLADLPNPEQWLGQINVSSLNFHHGTKPVTLKPTPPWVEQQIKAIHAARPNTATSTSAAVKEPLQEAAELILAGKDPHDSGLSAADLAEKTSELVARLCDQGRTDLAWPWMQKAPPAKGHLEARLRTADWTARLVAAGLVDAAVQLFESDNARWTRADPEITYFTATIPNYSKMTDLFRLARHRGDQAGLKKLSDMVQRLRQTTPPGYLTAVRLNNIDDWRMVWFEPLQLAGLSPVDEQQLQQIIEIAESTASKQFGKPNPARIPANATPETIRLGKAMSDENGWGLLHSSRYLALFKAKQMILRGDTEKAYDLILKADKMPNWMCAALAQSHASLGNWSAASDAMNRSARAPFDKYIDNFDAAARKSYDQNHARQRVELAAAFGRASAERLDAPRAAAILRGIADPLEKLTAICTYVRRLHELDTFTSEQRDFLRNLPPL